MTSAPIVPLRYLAKIDPGKSEVKHLPDDLEVDFIPMEAVGHGGLLHPVETRRLGEVRDGYTYLKSGDVSFAKISPSFQNRKGGRAKALTNDLAFATTELTVLRPDPTADARFLQFVIESEPFIQHGAATLHGVAGQQRVDLSRIAAYPVWLPRVEVQRRIADMLDTETARIDTLLDKNERVIELLQLRLRAEVLRVLAGSDAASVVGKAPVTYTETARLGLVVDTQLGKMLTPKPDIGLRETPYVKASDVLHDGTVRLSGLDTMYASAQEHRELSLREDDVLIIEGGATAGKAARVGDHPTEGIIFQNHVHRLRSRGTHVQPFLYWCMKAYEWSGWYDAYCFVTTFKGLPTGKLRGLPLPVLPINDQRRIVAYIEACAGDLDRLSRLVERQKGLLRTRRQSLITAAVTGQIEV